MDQKLSKGQFNQIVENAYPSYVLKLNSICFKRCVGTKEDETPKG